MCSPTQPETHFLVMLSMWLGVFTLVSQKANDEGLEILVVLMVGQSDGGLLPSTDFNC